ncbi:hypothetical protein ATSB10_23650 [Dyella thiooxydans]|uniref:Uncharacterized protein n=1 Tax=Dyella thiooxydans TaxID=445710 RepID=A0A161JJB3_9GAMM|nr:polysaccharide biosynthesis C-terminal domain-containing protein [Dyella thiooxydans]AND69819.1 hypothetical protein ATSB10_23650 [Dyella thiooxydans]
MSSLATPRWPLTALSQAWRNALGAIAMLWLATAAGAAMVFLTQMLLARALGAASYGLFASSLAMVGMVAPMAGFGLAQFWLRVYGGEGWHANRWLLPSVRFLGITTALTMAIIVAWALVLAPPDATVMLLVMLPVVGSVLVAALISSKLRLEERHRALALWQLMTPGGRLVVALLLLIAPGMGSPGVAVGYGAISLGVAALGAPQLRAMLHGGLALQGHGARPYGGVFRITPAARPPGLRSLWSQAWPFGLAATLYPIFFQTGTVLVKYFDGNTEAGIFGIALAVMSAIYLIPATLYQKFLLSKQQRWAVHDPATFWRIYRHGNRAMLAGGVLLALLMVATAPWGVPLAFGPAYRPVVPVLMILAACIPLRFLSTSVGSALLNERHMRYRVVAMGFCALLVVVLASCLIPAYRARGAAVATVVGELAMLLLLVAGVRRFYPAQDRPR